MDRLDHISGAGYASCSAAAIIKVGPRVCDVPGGAWVVFACWRGQPASYLQQQIAKGFGHTSPRRARSGALEDSISKAAPPAASMLVNSVRMQIQFIRVWK